MRILAVDYGVKRIGLATCDDLGISIRTVATLSSQGIKKDAHRLIEWVDALKANELVIGFPRTQSGTVTHSGRRVLKLMSQIGRLTSIHVTLWDERLTSKAADQWMKENAIPLRGRQALQDQIAACLILTDYLQQRAHDDAKTSV